MQLCVYMCILASSQSFCSATQLLLDILLWLHLLATMNNAVRNTVLGICLPLSLILLGNKEWNCWIVCSLLDSIFNFLGTCQTVFQAAARFYVPASDAQLLHTLWTSCYFPFFFFPFVRRALLAGVRQQSHLFGRISDTAPCAEVPKSSGGGMLTAGPRAH